MSRLALVTYAAAPELTPDDRLLLVALEAEGAAPSPVRWDEQHPWEAFDLVVLRSTWDYFLKLGEFSVWIDHLERVGAEVVNPISMVRWNIDKQYLQALEARGVKIVPTAFVRPDASPHRPLSEVLRTRGWHDAVVKPAISGGAHQTWRTSIESADEDRFARLLSSGNGGALIQPFVQEVLTDGELSLIFLDGVFSHAAVKLPRSGDFRVQQEHGGTYAPAAPSATVVEQAARVVATAAAVTGIRATDLAYARVDGIVRRQGGVEEFLLMELECIEPNLFFLQHPPAAVRMARSLTARLADRSATGR